MIKQKLSTHRRLMTAVSLVMTLVGPASAADRFPSSPFNDKACFTYPAVAMTPYDQSLDKYHMTHERAYHQDGKTGLVLLNGPVLPFEWNPEHTWVELQLVSRDPDRWGNRASVVAELRHTGPYGITTLLRTY